MKGICLSREGGREGGKEWCRAWSGETDGGGKGGREGGMKGGRGGGRMGMDWLQWTYLSSVFSGKLGGRGERRQGRFFIYEEEEEGEEKVIEWTRVGLKVSVCEKEKGEGRKVEKNTIILSIFFAFAVLKFNYQRRKEMNEYSAGEE